MNNNNQDTEIDIDSVVRQMAKEHIDRRRWTYDARDRAQALADEAIDGLIDLDFGVLRGLLGRAVWEYLGYDVEEKLEQEGFSLP